MSNESMVFRTQNFWKSKFDQLFKEKRAWIARQKNFNIDIQGHIEEQDKLKAQLKQEKKRHQETLESTMV